MVSSLETVTEIACVVDQSGSMHEVKAEAIEGFDQFLEEQREVEGAANLTLTLFNHEHEVLCRAEPIDAVEPLDDETFRPKGMTALLDAVGATIDALEARIEQECEGREPDRVLVLILTDGKENASSEYSGDDVAAKIREHGGRDDWEFLFWGANIDAEQVAARINIDAENVTQFASTGEQVSAVFGQMSQLTKSFRETGSLDGDFE
jgi:hypothetical protein